MAGVQGAHPLDYMYVQIPHLRGAACGISSRSFWRSGMEQLALYPPHTNIEGAGRRGRSGRSESHVVIQCTSHTVYSGPSIAKHGPSVVTSGFRFGRLGGVADQGTLFPSEYQVRYFHRATWYASPVV